MNLVHIVGLTGIPYIVKYKTTEEIESSINLFGINAVGSYPVSSSFTIFGKIGLDYSMTEVKYKWSDQEIYTSQSSWYPGTYYQSDGSTEKKKINTVIPHFALGTKWKISDGYFATLEYENFIGVADGKFFDLSTKYDASLLSIGFGMVF